MAHDRLPDWFTSGATFRLHVSPTEEHEAVVDNVTLELDSSSGKRQRSRVELSVEPVPGKWQKLTMVWGDDLTYESLVGYRPVDEGGDRGGCGNGDNGSGNGSGSDGVSDGRGDGSGGGSGCDGNVGDCGTACAAGDGLAGGGVAIGAAAGGGTTGGDVADGAITDCGVTGNGMVGGCMADSGMAGDRGVPLFDLSRLAVGDRVEAPVEDRGWAAACVLNVRSSGSQYVVELDHPRAPRRVWIYFAKEDEQFKKIMSCHYSSDIMATPGIHQALLVLQAPELQADLKPLLAASHVDWRQHTDRLRALTEVVLPDIYITEKDNERPTEISNRFHCEKELLLQVNRAIHGDELKLSSKLRVGTLMVLPPCWHQDRRLSPKIATPRLSKAIPEPPLHKLAIGEHVYVETEAINFDGKQDASLPAVWKQAVVMSSTDSSLIVSVDGDLEFKVELKLQSEGLDWIRANPLCSTYSCKAGTYLPPWAEWKQREVLTKMPPRPLPASPPPGWINNLAEDDACEVLFESVWQACEVDALGEDKSEFIVRLVDLGNYVVRCAGNRLRPCTTMSTPETQLSSEDEDRVGLVDDDDEDFGELAADCEEDDEEEDEEHAPDDDASNPNPTNGEADTDAAQAERAAEAEPQPDEGANETTLVKPLNDCTDEQKHAAFKLLRSRFPAQVDILKCLTGKPSFEPFANLVLVQSDADQDKKKTISAHSSGGPYLNDRHVALTTNEKGEPLGAAVLKLVRNGARDKTFWGCEVILFAVKEENEGCGIGRRQLQAIFDFCQTTNVPRLVILSAQAAEPASKNWWLHVSPHSNMTVMHGATVVTNLRDVELPTATFLLPWPLGEPDDPFCLLIKSVPQQGAADSEVEGEQEEEGEEEPAPPQSCWQGKRKVFAEFCCGSRRYANGMALFQWSTFSVDDGSKNIELEYPHVWNDQDKRAPLKIITPEEVHPDLFKGQGQLHIHVSGRMQDIPVEKLPTFTASHCAPSCASTSPMARNHHPRNEDEHYLATVADSSQRSTMWDFEVMWYRDVVRSQRRREGNATFGCTFEQPKTLCARKHLHIVNMEAPEANGGEGAKRAEVHICQLGSPCHKPTDIWHSKLPGVERELHLPDGSSRYKCPGSKAAPWHKHEQVRGATSKSVSYHRNLVAKLAAGVHESYLI